MHEAKRQMKNKIVSSLSFAIDYSNPVTNGLVDHEFSLSLNFAIFFFTDAFEACGTSLAMDRSGITAATQATAVTTPDP